MKCVLKMRCDIFTTYWRLNVDIFHEPSDI